jgi:copper resistance protein D
MEWLGPGINVPLTVIRAIHFAGSALTTGTLMFQAFVAEPIFRSGSWDGSPVLRQINRIAGCSLALAVATGAIWFGLVAVSMSGLPLIKTITSDVFWTALNETQFGRVATIRLGLAIVLAACFAFSRAGLVRWTALGAGLAFSASIAWTGHAGSTPGDLGALHVTADALHFCAAACWIGGLVSLALLLAACGVKDVQLEYSLKHAATQRFSRLGTLSVAILLISGILNAWILVGSLHLLLVTPYGRLLMLKAGLFALMLTIAALNRFWWTPQLGPSSKNSPEALRQLTMNSAVEILLGFTIFAVVGVLGTIHPAVHGL